ncbi:MAG: folate family ECF transporter S component [Lachnospiraceae bacterium]|nr:folate family ECF transporter S component [Lachnospiraceae bacterium]
MKKKFDVKMLALCGMLAAVCFVLGQVSGILDFQSVKVTLEGLPVLIAALMYGPVAGMAVGGIGTFISQCLGKYGLTITTPLWILPYFVAGLVVGLIAMKKKYTYKTLDFFIITAISEMVIMVLNTCGILIASKIEGWYYPTIITGNLGIRILIMIAKILIYSFIVPVLVNVVKKVDNRQYQ